MSSGVSQIEYWLKEPNTTGTKNGKSDDGRAVFLSYDVFMALSILGGFLALDHLYLRSPLTFLAKLIVNILFFGVWWLYDAAQAVFNDDTVKVFGLGVPSLGPKGIAAGVLAGEKPDKNHMRFFVYACGLIFTGLFGVDSFITGDKQSGFIRLISLITVVFAPIAMGWWLYKLFKFFTNTKGVIEENYEYFGAAPPPSLTTSFVNKVLEKVPFLNKLVEPVKKVGKAVSDAAIDAEELAEAVITNPKAVINTVVKPPIETIASVAEPIIKPFTNTAQTAIQAVDDVVGTVRETVTLGKNALNKGAIIAEDVIETAGETAKAATAVLGLAPMAASLSNGITANAIGKAKLNLGTQTGGAYQSNTLAYVLLGTFALIAVSGFIISYRRSRQNEPSRKDDRPPSPESGVLRESDKKESS